MNRRKIRLPRDAYARRGAGFHVIVSCYRQQRIFSNPIYAQPIYPCVVSEKLPQQLKLYAAVLMPDHLHLLVAVTDTNLIEILRLWKSHTAKLLKRLGFRNQVWQRSFWDHGIRNKRDLIQTAKYILENPLRLGLAVRCEDYPYLWCDLSL